MNTDAENANEINNVKKAILETAYRFKGQGDPDFTKQKELDRLVQKLIWLSPQKNVSKRINLISGPWKQIWGPYTYSDDSRGVDNSIDTENIFQVVFPEGYYYNVSPNFKKGDRTKIQTGLLRGEYVIDKKRENVINVKFTKLTSINGLPPDNLKFQDLPILSETGKLEGERKIFPDFLVKLFLGKGALREVYTDEFLRITYGSDRKNLDKNSIYILERVKN